MMKRALPAIELVRAPQPYIDYWRMFGAKPEGTWNPDKYIRIINGRTSVVRELLQRPTIRVRHNHYEKYRNYLERRRGYEAVAKWEAHRNRSWEREALLSRGELIALRLAQEQTELSGQIGERTRGDNTSGQIIDKEGIIGDC